MSSNYKLCTVEYGKATEYINKLYRAGHEIVSASTFFDSFDSKYKVTILYK